MAAPDPHSLGVPRPQFPWLCPACLPCYPLQTILRRGSATRANGHDALQPLALIFFFFSPFLRRRFGRLGFNCNRVCILKVSYFGKGFERRLGGPWRNCNRRGLWRSIC